MQNKCKIISCDLLRAHWSPQSVASHLQLPRGLPMPNGSVHYLTERIRECFFSFKISKIFDSQVLLFLPHSLALENMPGFCAVQILFLQLLAPGWALSVTLTSSDFVSNLIISTRTLVLRVTYSLPKPAFPPGLTYSLPHYIYHSSGWFLFWWPLFSRKPFPEPF